eukprot:gene30717-59974_t
MVDEIDPLDAFMTGIQDQLGPMRIKGVNDRAKTTIDERTGKEDAEEDEGESRAFIDALKKVEKKEEEAERLQQQADDDLMAQMADRTKEKDGVMIDYDEKEFQDRSYRLQAPEQKVKDLKELDKIKIKGDDAGGPLPAPIERWEQGGLADATLQTLKEAGFELPFPIQQILREGTRFLRPLGLRMMAVYGGVPVADQIAEARRGVHAIVGTPGRMIDLMVANKGRVLPTNRATYLVLDEADRMLDLGFGPQMAKITVMFSATIPKMIEVAAKKFMTKPVQVIVGGRRNPSSNVTQHVDCFEADEHRFDRLLQLLGEWHDKGLILIFTESQSDVDRLWEDLFAHGYDKHCITLHAGMDQVDRDLALYDFKIDEGYDQGRTRGFKFDERESRLKREERKAIANVTQAGSGALVVHPSQNIGKAQQYAVALSQQIAAKEEMAAQNKFSTEVEINDYPQSARWKVTNREAAIQQLLEDETAKLLAASSSLGVGRPLRADGRAGKIGGDRY